MNKGALVKLDYTAKIDGSTMEEAKEMVVAIGKNHVLKGLDEALQAADIGKNISVVIPPEKAYGQRNSELVKLVSLDVFKRQAIEPVPGMVVDVDGLPGKVQSVSGGRVRMDFNHELAGKTIEYNFTITQELATPVEKVSAIASQFLPGCKCSFEENGKIAVIEVPREATAMQGYLTAKAKMLSMLLSFVSEVSSVKVTEEYAKLSEPSEKNV